MKKIRKGRGEIIKISSLFEKYKQTLRAPEASVITAFQDVVDDLLDITVPKEKVTYKPKSKVISIQGGGPLKTEIYLHRDEILAHMKGRLGEKSAPKEIM